jgi:hypothetical protein
VAAAAGEGARCDVQLGVSSAMWPEILAGRSKVRGRATASAEECEPDAIGPTAGMVALPRAPWGGDLRGGG